MGQATYHLVTLTRCLDAGVRVAEALGLPEISALADSARAAQATLRKKARAVLQDPSLSPPLRLYRRRPGAEVTLDETELTLDPPNRTPGWQQPVRLRLPLVRWVEDDLHQAWVPSLGVLVFATQESLLSQKVVAHARLVLAGRHRVLSLGELARLARTESLALDRLEVAVELKSARQIAELGEEEEKEPSMLAKLAEELPPLVAQKTAQEPGATPPAAFEMEAELAQLAEALTGVLRHSVLLVGPAGSGKTALVRELGRRRREFGFAETPFWSTSGARLMTGQIGFGLWQERCQQMCREASRTRAIVHLNGLADLLEVGKASRGEQSVGGFLRPWIARGDLTVIAECTPRATGRPRAAGAAFAGRFPAGGPCGTDRQPDAGGPGASAGARPRPGSSRREAAASRTGLEPPAPTAPALRHLFGQSRPASALSQEPAGRCLPGKSAGRK